MQFWSILRPIGFVAILGAFAALPAQSHAGEPVTVAVADFDYIDPSGRVMDEQRVEAERLRELVQRVRQGLDRSSRYRVVHLACGHAPCSAGRTDPAELLAKARAAGARLLVYGGVQRMNAEVQYGNAEVVDLVADRLVFDRSIPFRNDNDASWRYAANFLVAELTKQNLVKSDVSVR
jgi:uncharacterized protein DUF2380